MPIHYYAEFFCDECGKGYGALVETQGGTPEPPPGWVCSWGAYICPACKAAMFGKEPPRSGVITITSEDTCVRLDCENFGGPIADCPKP